MRKSIETFFQCKCIDQYGQSEGVCIAQECSHGQMHVIPAAGIIEIVREDGSPCAPGEVGEVVATSLLNDAMPLIRYRMGDYAAWGVNQSCSCGNPHPIITNLEGRLDDYLLTSDGRKIGRLSTAVKRSPTIHSSQIVQDQLGHAYLLVRPGVGYQSSHAVAVKDDILERIGKFKIEIIEVAEIPKTPRGKRACGSTRRTSSNDSHLQLDLFLQENRRMSCMNDYSTMHILSKTTMGDHLYGGHPGMSH